MAACGPTRSCWQTRCSGTTWRSHSPIISDWWEGLDAFFEPGEEILISRSAEETLHYLRDLSNAERRWVGRRAKKRVLAEHTNAHRAEELEQYLLEALHERSRRDPGKQEASLSRDW